MASKSSAMVLSNHGGYIRGKSIPALPTNPATNPPGRFSIGIGVRVILQHYPRRASKMPILDNWAAPSCPSIMVSVRAMKLGSNAHNEHSYGCARAILQWHYHYIATDDSSHSLFHSPKIAGKNLHPPSIIFEVTPQKIHIRAIWCYK